MPKKLNKDGVPVTIPTVAPKKEDGLFRGVHRKDEPERDRLELPEDPPTQPARKGEFGREALSHFDTGDEPRTTIAVGVRKRSEPSTEPQPPPGGTPASPVAQPVNDAMSDPVVGWLVIVDGPGKGNSLRLGSGQNSIGRGADSRVRIDFGDSEISRSRHATVIFDPRHNKFHVKPGEGVNLVYLDGEPVLEVTPLPDGSTLELGKSKLRFVAFCDDDFSWSDS